jgi:hypothetical protein
MNMLLTHPLLKNDFQRELPPAADKSQKANPAFTWLVDHNAKQLLFKAISQCTTFKPTPGLDGKPSHWTAPPPCGPDQCSVIVMGLDGKGALRACASNAVPKPVRIEDPCPVKFFETFDALRSKAGQVERLHQVVSSVASKEHMDWVDRVFKEGNRCRTSPIFLIVLDGEKQYFYATTALIQGPQQIDRTLEWTGKVATKEQAS